MKEKCTKQQKKNKQRQKGARGTEAIVKGWELSDFVMHLSCFSFVVFCISLSSTVFIISTLIISIFYSLNYTLLLLHVFTTHLVIDFIITFLVISFFQ